MKNTSINMSEELHTSLKVYCAKNQVSMGAMIIEAITEKMGSDK